MQEKAHVNVGFWAGLVPSNAGDHSVLAALLYAGALGFKAFMCPSGIDDFAHVNAADLAAAIPFLKKRGAPLYVHAEVVPSETPEVRFALGAAVFFTSFVNLQVPNS